jgi:hypothetical protein
MTNAKFNLVKDNDVLEVVQCYYDWIEKHNLQIPAGDNRFLYHDMMHTLCDMGVSPFGETVVSLIEYAQNYGMENVISYDYVNDFYKIESKGEVLTQEQYMFIKKHVLFLYDKVVEIPWRFVNEFNFYVERREAFLNSLR